MPKETKKKDIPKKEKLLKLTGQLEKLAKASMEKPKKKG